MPEPIFTVERYPHGWLVRGGVPGDDMFALARLGGRNALMVPGISSALGATFAFCPTREDADAWRKEIDDAAARSSLDPLHAWLFSTDTGLSSKYLAWVMAGGSHGITRSPAVPLDMGDFGRCRRLVDRMRWHGDIHRMIDEGPEWARIVRHWDALVKLNDAGRHGRLDDIMTEIEAGGAS